MRVTLSCLLLSAFAVASMAFAPTTSKQTVVSLQSKNDLFVFCRLFNRILLLLSNNSCFFKFSVGYVPDGMTPEQWKRHQEEEKKKMARKNFAALGPQSFKSRSLQSFQTDLEKGKADHLLPVMFAKDRVKKGEIKETDVPCKYYSNNWRATRK